MDEDLRQLIKEEILQLKGRNQVLREENIFLREELERHLSEKKVNKLYWELSEKMLRQYQMSKAKEALVKLELTLQDLENLDIALDWHEDVNGGYMSSHLRKSFDDLRRRIKEALDGIPTS